MRELLALDRRQLREILLAFDLGGNRRDRCGSRQAIAQGTDLAHSHGDDPRFLAMALAGRSRLLALLADAVLRRTHLVRDALVLVRDPP